MSEEQTPHVNISTQPFLGDVLTRGTVDITTHDATPTRGNAHLLADVTGRATTPRSRAAQRATELAPVRDTMSPEEHIVPQGYLDVDWNQVMTLTRQIDLPESVSVRARGTFDVATAPGHPETPDEEIGLRQITEIVKQAAEWRGINGGPQAEWGEEQREHYIQAVFDQAFRYGRIQQYLREPDVEEISVTAHDRVFAVKTNGKREPRPAIAADDDDLERMIAEIAGYRGRTFARPGGDIDLDIGGARLSATTKEISEHPTMTIRKHNLVDVKLADLVELGTLNEEMARVLEVVTRANARILISGFPGTGKTTFLRALMGSVDPSEKLVTIETERELYLHKMPHRHREVQALQYIPSHYAGGDNATGYSLERAFHISLRSGAERILFAEIRGPEGPVAIKAMNAGKGSMSTIHSNGADDAIHRFADVLMSELGLSDDTVPLRQLMRNLDYIVHLDKILQPDGSLKRVVSEIAEVHAADDGRPIAAPLYSLNRSRGLYEKSHLSEARRKAYERRGIDTGDLP